MELMAFERHGDTDAAPASNFGGWALAATWPCRAEAQRRLAPHLHAAMRGTIPRTVIRQVRAATYHQLWWPAHDTPIYVDRLPQWSDERGGYVDPATGAVLPTWGQALDALGAEPDAEPAHVLRFGSRTTSKGFWPGLLGRIGRSAICPSTCTKTLPPPTTTRTPRRRG